MAAVLFERPTRLPGSFSTWWDSFVYVGYPVVMIMFMLRIERINCSLLSAEMGSLKILW
jgi:hypothetical protein